MFLKGCMNWNKIIQALKDGGVVTHPTDTCYGLACDPLNEEAMKKLCALKQMPRSKPVTWMVGSMGEAMKYGVFSEEALKLASEGWPGALTLVVPAKEYDGLIGLRVPGDDFTLEMLSRWGGPLTTTSANLHGQEPPYSGDAAVPGDYVVDMGEIAKNKPSRILRVTDEDVTVIRG